MLKLTMTPAQAAKVALYQQMGYEVYAEHPDGTVWLAKHLLRDKMVTQQINRDGTTILTKSRYIEER